MKDKDIMKDKDAMAQDWKMVGDAFQVALGQKRYEIPSTNFLDAFLKGVLTLNPFGTTIKNRCKHR